MTDTAFLAYQISPAFVTLRANDGKQANQLIAGGYEAYLYVDRLTFSPEGYKQTHVHRRSATLVKEDVPCFGFLIVFSPFCLFPERIRIQLVRWWVHWMET